MLWHFKKCFKPPDLFRYYRESLLAGVVSEILSFKHMLENICGKQILNV